MRPDITGSNGMPLDDGAVCLKCAMIFEDCLQQSGCDFVINLKTNNL